MIHLESWVSAIWFVHLYFHPLSPLWFSPEKVRLCLDLRKIDKNGKLLKQFEERISAFSILSKQSLEILYILAKKFYFSYCSELHSTNLPGDSLSLSFEFIFIHIARKPQPHIKTYKEFLFHLSIPKKRKGKQ